MYWQWKVAVVHVFSRSVMLSQNLKGIYTRPCFHWFFSLQDIQKDSCESNHNITCKVGYPFLKPAEEVNDPPACKLSLPCVVLKAGQSVSPLKFFSLVFIPKLCMHVSQTILGINCTGPDGKLGPVRCGMWGCNGCILPSLTQSEGKWHTNDSPGQKCLSWGFPQPEAYFIWPSFVILCIKCSALIEDRIRCYVEVLTQICQSQGSRPHLRSVGNERPFHQVVHLKPSSILNSSSTVCIFCWNGEGALVKLRLQKAVIRFWSGIGNYQCACK